MPRIALRLLLALCLILNGIGNAMASGAMPSMAGNAHDAALVAVHAADADNATGAACSPDGHAATAVDPPPPASHPADCGKDCCAPGACTCPCMNVVQAALPGMDTPASPDRARMVAAVALGHSTPVLLNLIRPPIG